MRMTFRVLLVAAFLLSGAPAAHAQAVSTESTPAREAFMMDYDTGMVLFEKNADQRMPTSSMSKTMTMYLVFEALKNGRLTLDGTLNVSEKAWRMEGSKMFIEVGKSVKVEDLMRGVIIQSGNDATVALAEGLSGTEALFADALNAKAKELGMLNSHFMNASGWPDPEHYSTARDLAILATHLIRDFPEYYHYFAEKEFVYHNIKQGNRNPLLYRNIGADGLKTGHTEAAGYGLIASGTQNNRRVILVVNGLADEQARADESARLLEWGLRGFENVSLFKAGDTVENAAVLMGRVPQVPLTVEQDLTVTIPMSVRNDLNVEVNYTSPLPAPLRKGDKVGTLVVAVPRMGTTEYPLVVAQDVGKIGFFSGIVTKAKLMLISGVLPPQ